MKLEINFAVGPVSQELFMAQELIGVDTLEYILSR
jgi:hypothetical protein